MEQAAASRPWTVLAVDDEPDILETLRDFVESELPGALVVTAGSAAEALERLRTTRVDLILTDYKMPGMNGLELLREARRLAPAVPRIMLTAFPDMNLAIQALNEEHILHFFTKPLAPDLVLDVLRAVREADLALAYRDAAFRRSLDAMRARRARLAAT